MGMPVNFEVAEGQDLEAKKHVLMSKPEFQEIHEEPEKNDIFASGEPEKKEEEE